MHCQTVPALFKTHHHCVVCVCVVCVCMCVCACVRAWGGVCAHAPAWGNQRMLGPLQLELGGYELPHVDAENWTGVLLKSSKCSNHWAIHLSSPLIPKLQVYNAMYHMYPTPIKLLEETVPRTFPLLQLWFLEIIFHRKLEVRAAMFYKYNLCIGFMYPCT